eukprot:5617967-Amphidinium_carterae.1
MRIAFLIDIAGLVSLRAGTASELSDLLSSTLRRGTTLRHLAWAPPQSQCRLQRPLNYRFPSGDACETTHGRPPVDLEDGTCSILPSAGHCTPVSSGTLLSRVSRLGLCCAPCLHRRLVLLTLMFLCLQCSTRMASRQAAVSVIAISFSLELVPQCFQLRDCMTDCLTTCLLTD